MTGVGVNPAETMVHFQPGSFRILSVSRTLPSGLSAKGDDDDDDDDDDDEEALMMMMMMEKDQEEELDLSATLRGR